MDNMSDAFQDHTRNPRRRGELHGANGVGASRGECPDTIRIFVRIRGAAIEAISFEAAGCDTAVACGSMLAEMAEGKFVDDAAEITPDTLITALGGLPADKRHVAQLACEALDNAMWDYVVRSVEEQSP